MLKKKDQNHYVLKCVFCLNWWVPFLIYCVNTSNKYCKASEVTRGQYGGYQYYNNYLNLRRAPRQTVVNNNYSFNTNAFDGTVLENYFKNNRLVDFQSKCLFVANAPCDIIGRWIKARLAGGLLGICPGCTSTQKNTLLNIISYLRENRPDVYEKAVKNYLDEDQLLSFVKSQNENENGSENGNKIDVRELGLSYRNKSEKSDKLTTISIPVPIPHLSTLSMESKDTQFNIVVNKNLLLLDDLDIFTTPKSSRSFNFPILKNKRN